MTNDTAPNFLFLNRGRNGWQENGVAAGIAYSASGNLRSGMGVDAADVNGDGWQDVFVANIDHEMFSLYENHKGAFFTDAAQDHGVAQATRLLSGWGLKFCDFDNDGHVDLLVANGHPDDTISLRAPEVRYKEPLLLFRNDGRHLRNVSQQAGPVFARHVFRPGAGRGRLRQRRARGRPHRVQRRRAGAAAQHHGARGPRQPLGRPEAAGRHVQSRRDRRTTHVVRRRRPAVAAEKRRRQLPLVARSARSARPRSRNRARLAGNQVAGTASRHRAIHERHQSIAT